MNIALRLAMACFVIAAPTLLYLGLLRGLERLRDDALLMRLAESDDAPQRVSAMAARSVEDRPAHEQRPVCADGRGSGGAGASANASASANAGASASAGANAGTSPSANAGASGRPTASERPPESVACGSCGASNMLGARYCGECLNELR